MSRKCSTLGPTTAMLLLLAALGACAGTPPADPAAPTAFAEDQRAATVDVESRYWTHVQVFLRVGATRVRLGEIERTPKRASRSPRARPVASFSSSSSLSVLPIGSRHRRSTPVRTV